MLTILPSGFFSLCGQSEQLLNNATNQKPTCCASLLRSRKTLFDLWYRSCAVFLPAGNFHAGWWTQAFHQGWNASPAVSWYTLEGLTALANPERSVFSKLRFEVGFGIMTSSLVGVGFGHMVSVADGLLWCNRLVGTDSVGLADHPSLWHEFNENHLFNC